MHIKIKRIQPIVIAGLLLLTLILPQVALAGPVISTVSATDITATTVEISWITNTNSDSRVNYGTNTTVLSETKYDSATSTTHNIILTGLSGNTKYYFEVQSTDISGTTTDNNGGAFYSFTTLTITEYSITLDSVCGVCGELIEVGLCGEVIGVTAIVAAAGTYYIRWDSLTGNILETFTATGPGSHTLAFYMPEAKKGIHYVYLTLGTDKKAEAIYEVLPSVKIDPEEGPVGSNVTFNGYGFNASQEIRVSFLGTVIKTGTANSVGSWNASYTIPPTPAGGYTFDIEAKEGTVWVNWVSKYFRVIAQITVTPDSGTVGEIIKVEGTGFASDEEDIEITFDGEVRRENIFADDYGSWSTTITVPIRICGRYAIDASGKSTRARNVEDVLFTVVPGLTVTPDLAYVGDSITVTGGGFTPEEEGINVYFDGTLVTAALTADINGCWESSFVLRASTYGEHIVSASGDITQPAVTTTLNTQTKLETLSPDEGAPGDSVTLTGSGFSGNKELTVTIGGREADLGDSRTQTNGNVVISFRVPKGSPEGKQIMAVTDEGGATASANFTVKKKVLATPQPISPEKETKLRSGQITFRWGGITGNSSITYILQISNSPDVTTYVWHKSDIETPTYTLLKDEALPQGSYYWWVKAVDDYGNESLWSSSSSLTISPIPTWVWVVVGLVVLVGLMVVAYRQTKFKVTD